MTTLVTLLHIYVFVRLDSISHHHRWVDRKVAVGAGVALWLIFFSGRLFGGDEYGLLTVALEVAGMHWMASIFLLAVGLFVADLVCGFGFLPRKMRIRLWILGLAAGTAMVVVAHVQGFLPPAVETHEITLAGLPSHLDGTTVAVMTDLHAGEIMAGPRWLGARVDQVQRLQPDLIVLVGDLFERGSNPAELAPVMERLSAPLGVWAVRGNHDRMRLGRRDVAREILSTAGIPLLDNEWVGVADGLALAGIDDLTSSRHRPEEGEANINRALSNRKAEATIFLSHTPWMADRAAASGADLMFSGHTHNGQIWPFNHLVRSRYPFVGGRYEVDGMTLVVSRGTGTWGPRMRLWEGGEISLITLRAAKNGSPT